MSRKPKVAETPPDSRGRDHGVTWRVVVISVCLALGLGYCIPVIDYKFMNTFLGAGPLPPGAIAALLILVLVVNPALGMLSQKLRFSRNECLTVYITCLFSCLIPGHGGENFIVPNLLAPFYYADSNNKWMEILGGGLKPWITPALNPDGTVNRAVVENWYLKGPIPWEVWLLPLAFWMLVALTTYAMLGCLSAILRAQWVEKEALVFPLLKLPLQLTEDMDGKDKQGAFFRQPLAWSGIGVAVFIEGLRGLAVYYPDVPTFPLRLDMGPLLREAPWNQLGGVPVEIYPMAVGISYLLVSEVSFSLWFFYLFMKYQLIVLYSLGYPAGTLPTAASALPGKAFAGFQMAGCYIVFVGFVLWTAREHLGLVARRALGLAKPTAAEAGEPLSYPAAFWGFWGSFALLITLTCLSGVRMDLALALWGGYLMCAIGLSRVAAEGGMLSLLNDSAPLGIVGRLVGPSPSVWLSTQAGVVPASFFQAGFTVHMRAFIMPSFLHAWKLAHERGIAARRLLALIAVVILISTAMGLHMAVRLGYENGGLALTHKWWATVGPLWPATFSANMSRTSDNPVWINWGSMGLGGLLTFVMLALRSRFATFPFHPIGYLMCQTYPGSMFWFSIFLGWLAKTIITRFGGNEGYRSGSRFFLGLVFGEVIMILLWLAVDGIDGRVSHALLPQ